ncbi:hypothetical protein EVJ50_06775 [Synechococcus sp. RSCCF101]|uniref:hypothetical protein n=1 Tax=Synechococcus sp. RSCCF101 TaxID=2511069 RepID=UPI001244310D|nr:hypothetical protein [Synechococcus sp. RSCCF101]QEY31984.1 hypothetical protein EVJ50_06775 [Synechococcus sp. RSCCF101]
MAQQIATGVPSRDVIAQASATWGLSTDDARALVRQGHEGLAAEVQLERHDYLASRLAITDRILYGALRTRQWGQAAAVVKLQLEMTGLGKGVC